MKNNYIAIDTETTGLNWMKDTIEVVSFAEYKKSWAYRWKTLKQVEDILKDNTLLKLFWSKYDWHMFRRMGITEINNWVDVRMMIKLLDENLPSYHLKDVAVRYIDPKARELMEKLQIWRDKNMDGKFDSSKIPDNILLPYAVKDAEYTLKLYDFALPSIEKEFMKPYLLEKEISRITCFMEERGHLIDITYLKKRSKLYTKEINTLTVKIRKMLGIRKFEEFNLNSNKQLAEAFTKKHIIFPMTEKGNPQLNQDTLPKIDHPAAKLIIELKQAVHIQSTYCDGLVELATDGILHCNLDQYGARTNRFSCSNPNLQNIPKEAGDIRRGFIVRENYYNFYFDYSQIEMIILTDYCQDDNMFNAVKEGRDLHIATAARFYDILESKVNAKQRHTAKTINFAIVYGMGATGLSEEFKITKNEAQHFLNRYYELYPAVRNFNKMVQEKVCKEGNVNTFYGHRRRLEKIEAYKGVNAIIQGSASDLIKLAMVKIDKLLQGTKSSMLLQIHDELIIEVYKSELNLVNKIKSAMEDFKEYFDVPIKVDIKYAVKNWSDKKLWRNK